VTWPISGYELQQGTIGDRALLVAFMRQTYRERSLKSDLGHLRLTVEQYFSSETPLWWVVEAQSPESRVGSLWVGSSIDQASGERQAYIFLLYVDPQHRRRGLGQALLQVAEDWAENRGDRQIGLQMFADNDVAAAFYRACGYGIVTYGMQKGLSL
jgi:ribosomal protein S18 acetylase RimI-like enzyme